ncbi:MAG: hypothetical protein AB2792_12890 [Candidatus Thiodiazotropha sp.]
MNTTTPFLNRHVWSWFLSLFTAIERMSVLALYVIAGIEDISDIRPEYSVTTKVKGGRALS